MPVTISTSEYAAGALIDAEFLAKMRENLNYAIGSGTLRRQIPNHSFELTTGTLPKFWTVATDGGCDVAISTGTHGNYAVKLTKAAGTGKAEIISDYIPRSGGSVEFNAFFVWASNTSVQGGLFVQNYDKYYNYITENSTMRTNYAATPRRYVHSDAIEGSWSLAWTTRYIKVGFRVTTASTVAGDVYVDGITMVVY